jgi:hypothetical protein
MALTADRNTRSKGTPGAQYKIAVKASTIIYEGSIVAVAGATGYAEPAADTAGQIVQGVCMEQADNSDGAAGDIEVTVRKGTFYVTNNGTNPVVQATIGDDVHIQDDQTVRISGSVNSIVAGKVESFDSGGVWIRIS